MIFEAVVSRFIAEVRRGTGDDAIGLSDGIVGPFVACCSFPPLLEDKVVAPVIFGCSPVK